MRRAMATLLAMAAAGLGVCAGFVVMHSESARPTQQTRPPSWRDLYPHQDPVIAQQINLRLNAAMDLIESKNPGARSSNLHLLRESTLDANNDLLLRSWSLYAIARVIDEADLLDHEVGRLAQTYLDMVSEEHGEAPPHLRLVTRARIIQNDLYIYEEFAAALVEIENDLEVAALILELGIEPSWWRDDVEKKKSAEQRSPESAQRKLVALVESARDGEPEWRFTFEEPSEAWFATDFDDDSWEVGAAGFGVKGTRGAIVRTRWSSSDIWLRREFALEDVPEAALRFLIHHNDDAEIYLNGSLVAQLKGHTNTYIELPLNEAARQAIRVGVNVLAVHCRQNTGGQSIDLGIYEVAKEALPDAEDEHPQDNAAQGASEGDDGDQ